jgi:putative peptidoglycan lipid II flippase
VVSKSFLNIGVVAGATLASRCLGLVRDALVTAVFGLEALASAFYTAFTLPNLFRRLLGEGALTAALVPTLQQEIRAAQREAAFRLVNRVASWLLVVTGGMVAGGMLVLAFVPRWLAGRAGGTEVAPALERWLVAADLAVILFPYLVCICLAAVFSAALQTLNRFLEPALSPVWLNLAMIGCLGGAAYGGWSASPEGRMLWLCAGTLLGGVLQLVVPALALRREGWRPRFGLGVDDGLRQILRLMAPTVFGSAIHLINISVSRFVGLSLNDSAVAILNLATRLMELPIGVFTLAVSTVVFPLIARHAAAEEWDAFAASYRKGMRLILVINLPAAAGLALLAEPIVRVLFQRGEFGPADTAAMRPVLAIFAAGLPFLAFTTLVLRAFYAEKDTATPVRAAALSFVVNLGLSLILMGQWGTLGLAVASNVALAAQAVHLQVILARRRPGLAFHHLRRDLGKILLATAAMAGLVRATHQGWVRWSPAGLAADAAGLAVTIGLGAGFYVALLWLLRLEGREELAAIGQRFRERIGGAR